MTRTQTRLIAVLLLFGVFGPFWWYFPTFSADLMAVWLAGKYLAAGQADQVYAAMSDYFLMYPPDQWRPFMAAEYDYSGPIYPFLYPPIWARIAGYLSGANFWALTVWALMLNAALQAATVWLALRAVAPRRMPPALFVAMGLFFLLGTHIGTISLQQNQPQILVSFLLVLAVERARARADVAAGAALALAAAIKLYPALFAVYWLTTGNRRALASFTLIGGGLGLTSVLWAGWPLHAEFLAQVRLISASVLTTAITFNLDATIAQLFFAGDLIRVPGLEPPTPAVPDPGWYSMPRPVLWQVLSPLALLAGFAWTVRLFVRADHATRHAVIWPLGLTLVALLAPLSWAYYFIPTAAFAPVLIERLGIWRGSVLWGASVLLIFGPLVRYWRLTEDLTGSSVYSYQWAGFTAFALICYAFWQASRQPQQAP